MDWVPVMELLEYKFSKWPWESWLVKDVNTLVNTRNPNWCIEVTFDGRYPVHQGAKAIIGEYLPPQPIPAPKKASDTQVGGNHYTKCPIQPFEYSMANKLDPMQHTIIKYVTRFRDKAGIADLEKARHTIDLLIEWEKKNAVQSKAQ